MAKFQKRVLVFPGGTEVGLEIWRSLRHCKEVKLFSAASGVKQHAPFVYARHREIPPTADRACLGALRELIEEWAIDCIFPANALVIDFLDLYRDDLPCKLIAAPSDVLAMTRSKTATYDTLRHVFAVPELHVDVDENSGFPLFIKPDAMYGAQGARIVESHAEFLARPPGPGDIVCEYLPGEEFTVDCFSDRHGEILFAGPRTRERIRMGTSMHSETPSSEVGGELCEMAAKIQQCIPMRGAWFFQAKVGKHGHLVLLEVESRIAGTMAMHRVQGVNFALLSILDAFDLDVRVHSLPAADVVIDRVLTNRYAHSLEYDTVYVDLDDTIIVNGQLNLVLIRFLYQCVNKGIRLVLVSKSVAAEPSACLDQWRIAPLFDAVHWLRESESKVDYMLPGRGIFIDDSFSQRMEAEARLGIPTFDPSMVELLLDERI
jgi:carbamoyl-phosphate synthase large subunit